MMQKMSGDSTQTGRVSTLALSILVALAVIAVLAAAEYAIPRWLHPGPGDSGSFFSSNSSAPGPSAPTSRPAPSTRPEPNSSSAADRYNRSAKKHASAHKPSADAHSDSEPSPPSDSQASSDRQNAAQSSPSGVTARAAEEKLRATEDATAHLVALEREELDRLSDRVRAMTDRIEAAQKQHPALGSQREDLAFSQQRVQNDLNQADVALKAADVQKAKFYLDLAKGELEKIARLLAR
jgi:predicted  nucleic acid-binding Zn-ribbon protein